MSVAFLAGLDYASGCTENGGIGLEAIVQSEKFVVQSCLATVGTFPQNISAAVNPGLADIFISVLMMEYVIQGVQGNPVLSFGANGTGTSEEEQECHY